MGAGSGPASVVINTRSRATSSDINKLQQLSAQGQSELIRWLADVNQGSGGEALTQNLVQGTPSDALIIAGGMFRPTNGSVNCTIDPIFVAMIDPDGATVGGSPGNGGSMDPSDSVMKLVQDPGVQSGVLFLTPNSTGVLRNDYVEFSRSPGAVIQSESVDIFNTTTGLFSPATLPIYTKDGISYRIRTGPGGPGFPALDQGWAPLAIVQVPPSTTTFDACTVWDVRNLLCDRDSVSNVSPSYVRRTRTLVNGVSAASTTGAVHIVWNNKKVGGPLLRGTPGVDATVLDMTSTANFAADVAGSSTGQIATVCFAFPGGFPRMMRYTDAVAGPRVPRGPAGIPILSVVEFGDDGLPLSGVSVVMPTSLGFGAIAAPCVRAYSTFVGAGALSEVYGCDGGYAALPPGAASAALPINAGSPNGTTGTITAGVHFPAGARKVRLVFSTSYTSFAASGMHILTYNVAGQNVALTGYMPTTGGFCGAEAWFVLPPPAPGSSPAVYNVSQTSDDLFDLAIASFVVCRGVPVHDIPG